MEFLLNHQVLINNMKKEEKNKIISLIDKNLKENRNFYLADISGLNSEQTSNLRRLCYKREVSLSVVKNTLLKKAFELNETDFSSLDKILNGNTSIMFSESTSVPAKVIKEFRKKNEKPILKAAHIDEEFYIGDEHLSALASLKSKEELIGDIITLLDSPIKNVIASLKSSNTKISNLLKSIEEKASSNKNASN